MFNNIIKGDIMNKIEAGEIFTISEDGEQEQEVEVLGTLDVEGSTYAAVGFVEDIKNQTDGDIDIFLLKVDADGDLAAIESDEEFEKVSAAFDKMIDNQE
jgi:uncharacterized protein YrzB (UPF0473 family)